MAQRDQVIYGIHTVREALDSGREIDRVLFKRGTGSDSFKTLQGELRKRGIAFQLVPVEKLNRITRKNHQGVVAFLSLISYADLGTILPSIYESGEDPLVLLLDGISDVRNFGAIVRSAECAGIHVIVIPEKGGAAVNPDAIKTSGGALLRVPVCRHRDLVAAARFLRESGLRLFAATEKADTTLFDADMTGPAAIIMGSEGSGISPALLKFADLQVSVPMKGNIASLNVSVAAGIMLFEVVRQRKAGIPGS
jgi:23S rRNA (guanosine2251-2'-O)-methyltransferase